MKIAKSVEAQRFNLDGFTVPENDSEHEALRYVVAILKRLEEDALKAARGDCDWRATAKLLGQANAYEQAAMYFGRCLQLKEAEPK